MRTIKAFALLLALASSGRAMTVSELQDQMVRSGSQTQTMRFDYQQKVTSELTPEVRGSSGKAFIQKPKFLRIEQVSPEKQLVVGSGKNVFVYTPRFKQVMKDSWDKWSKNNLFFPGLSGFEDSIEWLKRDYRWEIKGSSEINGEKTTAVRLSRQQKGEESQVLDLWLGESDFIPRKTQLVMGTLTLTTTLSDLHKNDALDPNLFKFETPAKTHVIPVP